MSYLLCPFFRTFFYPRFLEDTVLSLAIFYTKPWIFSKNCHVDKCWHGWHTWQLWNCERVQPSPQGPHTDLTAFPYLPAGQTVTCGPLLSTKHYWTKCQKLKLKFYTPHVSLSLILLSHPKASCQYSKVCYEDTNLGRQSVIFPSIT